MAELGVFAILYATLAGGASALALGWAGGYGWGLARKGQRRGWVPVVFTVTFAIGLTMLVLAVVALSVRDAAGTWGTLSVVGLLLVVFSIGLDRAVKRRYAQAPAKA